MMRMREYLEVLLRKFISNKAAKTKNTKTAEITISDDKDISINKSKIKVNKRKGNEMDQIAQNINFTHSYPTLIS